ncbi:MAG: DsrE family protein [Myxococcales bacterium]|nr:DsrE family protein [Myxococcales bacterium]
MKVLQVIETAYRCNLEEQDDPAVWITHAMKGAGADLGVLLTGNAVNYAVKAQDASGLSFGGKVQAQPPNIARDVAKLVDKGIEVHLVSDDAAARGIESSDLIEGVKPITRRELAALYDAHDQVWNW